MVPPLKGNITPPQRIGADDSDIIPDNTSSMREESWGHVMWSMPEVEIFLLCGEYMSNSPCQQVGMEAVPPLGSVQPCVDPICWNHWLHTEHSNP